MPMSRGEVNFPPQHPDSTADVSGFSITIDEYTELSVASIACIGCTLFVQENSTGLTDLQYLRNGQYNRTYEDPSHPSPWIAPRLSRMLRQRMDRDSQSGRFGRSQRRV